MRLSKILFLFTTLMLMTSSAFATLTFTSAAGVSGYYAQDPDSTATTPGPVIYGGFAGTCTPSDSYSTCNSCVATSSDTYKLTACNFAKPASAGYVTLTLTSTDTSISTVKWGLSSSDSNTPTYTISGTTLTVQILWSDICYAAKSDSSCQTAFSNDLTVTVTPSSGSTTSTLTVRVVANYVASSSNSTYTDCPDANSSTVANTGMCHFEAGAGDEKIYLNDLAYSSGYPVGPNSINFSSIVMFYEAKLSTDTSNSDVLARITNASAHKSIDTRSATSDNIDNIVDGLTNDTTYCMLMANQDITGNISYFTDSSGIESTLCTTPEPVAGLLDDKHCFIATAAFGSQMAPEVQSFRDFRNKYLLPYSWGRSFVKAYYHYSPKYANMIAQNDTAKAVVRAGLWPMLFFARATVAFGFWQSLLVLAFMGLAIFEIYRRMNRKVKGEL